MCRDSTRACFWGFLRGSRDRRSGCAEGNYADGLAHFYLCHKDMCNAAATKNIATILPLLVASAILVMT